MRTLLQSVFFAAMSSSCACAQVKRLPTMTQPRAALTLGDTITVSASPASVAITLVPGAMSAASSTITVSTSWAGISLFSSFSLWASFGSSATALSSPAPVNYIPSSLILGQDSNGIPTSFTAFTATSPMGATGALELYQASSILNLTGSHSDSLVLQINLASLPQLPAAIYSGTISFQAQAF